MKKPYLLRHFSSLLIFVSVIFLFNGFCSSNMLMGKEIRTKKVLSDGYMKGERIYFLCEYVLSEPGTTIIPMYIATSGKVYYHSVDLYSFDVINEKLTRLAALEPSSMHMGGGDVTYSRWTAHDVCIYFMYKTGWDKTSKKSVYDLFRYDPVEKRAVEVTGDERDKLVVSLFNGSFRDATRKNNVPFTQVWYHVGGLSPDAWGLALPTDYKDLTDRMCIDVIVEQRGDRYFRGAVFRKIKASLSPGKAKSIIESMEKQYKKLPGDRQMTYTPYYEEWKVRLMVESLYGNEEGVKDTLESALYKMENERTEEFLNSKPDVNSKDDDGRTPLMIAAYADNRYGINALLKRGADINAQDKSGCTPLMYAVFGNAPHALELLIKKGADIQLEIYNGWNTWMFVSSTELRQKFLKNTGR